MKSLFNFRQAALPVWFLLSNYIYYKNIYRLPCQVKQSIYPTSHFQTDWNEPTGSAALRCCRLAFQSADNFRVRKSRSSGSP